MKRLALATSMIATALTVWAQQFPGAPEYPQGDPRSPQGNQGVGVPDNGPDDAQADAPDRGVARISFMNGNVSVRRGDSGDMVAAIVNAPLTIGDRLVTADGRAEVQFDSANMIRLGPASEVRFSELQYHRYQIQVAAGTVSFRVLRDSDAQVEISTPSISLRPVRRGIYRIDIHPDGTTGITLRAGADGEVFGPRGSEPVHNNSTMLVRGSGNDPEFQVTGPAPEDEFDRWAASRDAQLERAVAPRYVPRDVYGAEDLDGNGRWVDDGSYGQVWQPTGVDPDWAPYRCGRWVWMDYYGWTWVGCESWGWAPYHYGRWYYGSYGWCWWPGPLSSRYYWRPALVGFFGWGGGVGFGAGFGFGNVGWVPLAPFERFHPWYGRGYYGGYRGATVVNNINVTKRFSRTLGPLQARVRFLPHMAYRDYLDYLTAADVILDPFHFGGCNSSCDALSLAVPVVTLPGLQLPGRFTLGLYKEIDLDRCIARSPEDFVEIAVRLGREPDYRKSVSEQISARSARLFDRPDAGLALGEELLRLVEAAR